MKLLSLTSMLVPLVVLLVTMPGARADRIRSNAMSESTSLPPGVSRTVSGRMTGGQAVMKGEILEEDEERLDVERRKKEREMRRSRSKISTSDSGASSVAAGPAALDTPEIDSDPSSSSSSSSSSSTPAASTGPSYDPWSDNFLLLLHAGEGISHWKYVVNDVFLLAMDTNRTFVEPCIKDGKIFPCMHLMANETLTLSTIIDMSVVKSRFQDVRMISYAEYALKYKPTTTSIVCYSKNSRSYDKSSLDFDNAVINAASLEGNDKTHEDCLRTAKNFGNSVYFFSPFKDDVMRRGQAMTMTLPWKYAPFQHTIATRIMKDAKIDLDKYFVFNWRAQGVQKKHLIPCAKMLMAMSEEWLEKYDGDRLNAMIVTDMTFDKSNPFWGDMSDQLNANIQGNVTKLINDNFFKIETSNAVKGTIKQFPRYRDSIFLTIWEIIIAEKAIIFVSCGKQNEVCDYCQSMKSKFTEDIIRNRFVAKLNSYESWSIQEYTKTKPVSITEYLESE